VLTAVAVGSLLLVSLSIYAVHSSPSARSIASARRHSMAIITSHLFSRIQCVATRCPGGECHGSACATAALNCGNSAIIIPLLLHDLFDRHELL
jgi:hypothetical protein